MNVTSEIKLERKKGLSPMQKKRAETTGVVRTGVTAGRRSSAGGPEFRDRKEASQGPRKEKARPGQEWLPDLFKDLSPIW